MLLLFSVTELCLRLIVSECPAVPLTECPAAPLTECPQMAALVQSFMKEADCLLLGNNGLPPADATIPLCMINNVLRLWWKAFKNAPRTSKVNPTAESTVGQNHPHSCSHVGAARSASLTTCCLSARLLGASPGQHIGFCRAASKCTPSVLNCAELFGTMS